MLVTDSLLAYTLAATLLTLTQVLILLLFSARRPLKGDAKPYMPR